MNGRKRLKEILFFMTLAKMVSFTISIAINISRSDFEYFTFVYVGAKYTLANIYMHNKTQ